MNHKEQIIEFTLIRDNNKKITRIVQYKTENIIKSFNHEPGIIYHYTNKLDDFNENDLTKIQIVNNDFFSSTNQLWKMKEIKWICEKNKKELFHTEDILLSDFTIWDRMEAHILWLAHINCHALLTCELNGEIYIIFHLSTIHGKLSISPFTVGWHVVINDEVKNIIESYKKYSHQEFQKKIFYIIHNNISKEIEEETGIYIEPSNITYFKADNDNPKKTYLHFTKNFSKVTKLNEEDIHIFHAHLSKEQINDIVADKDDGVELHVATPLKWVENILKTWNKIPIYTLNWQPLHFHKREKFSSNKEYQVFSHLIEKDDLNQDCIKIEPNYIPIFMSFVKENLKKTS